MGPMALPVLYNTNSPQPQQQLNNGVQHHSGQVVGESQPPQMMVGANQPPTENSVGGARPRLVSIANLANSGLPPALINALQNGTLEQQIQQIMIILRSIPLFEQYKKKILALLNVNPELMAALIKQRTALNKRRTFQPIMNSSHQQRMSQLQQRMRKVQQLMRQLQLKLHQRHQLQAMQERELQKAAMEQRQLQQAMEQMKLEPPMNQQRPGYTQQDFQNDQFAFLMQPPMAASISPQQQGLSGLPQGSPSPTTVLRTQGNGLQDQPVLSPKQQQAPSPIHPAQTQSSGLSRLSDIPDLNQLQNQDLGDLYNLIREERLDRYVENL